MTVTSYLESFAEIIYRLETGEPKPRPSTYHGITFRSRLEARFARHLDAIGEEWLYEPRPYGTKGHGYLPDFEILSANVPTFIEVKPTLEEVPAATRKMSVIWDSRPDALLVVACEQTCAYFAALKGQEWEGWYERWAA